MTKSSQLEAPYNPFLTDEQLVEIPPERILTIASDSVPRNADEFEKMAEVVVDWSSDEVRVLYDAARYVRWMSHETYADERKIVERQFNGNGRILNLLLSDVDGA